MPVGLSGRIPAITKQFPGRCDAGVGNFFQSQNCRHRVCHDFGDGRIVIGQTIDKAGVGAIFQEAANQIGQQVFMAADGCIDAAGLVGDDLRIKRFAHAMQALEFVALVVTSHNADGGDGLGVVGGKLWIEKVTPFQHEFRTSQIAHIG